jgi:sigma54-dependent transcription regulator
MTTTIPMLGRWCHRSRSSFGSENWHAGRRAGSRAKHRIQPVDRSVKDEFVDVNCVMLVADGATSAQFGHTKRVFTGVSKDPAGFWLASTYRRLYCPVNTH